MSFPFLNILNYLQSYLTLYILPSLSACKRDCGDWIGMAEKSSWDQANIRQNLNLVWRKRKIISQIIKDYFYLPFFLWIILWHRPVFIENSSIDWSDRDLDMAGQTRPNYYKLHVLTVFLFVFYICCDPMAYCVRQEQGNPFMWALSPSPPHLEDYLVLSDSY